MEKMKASWSVPVTVEDIPEGGLHFELKAPAEARAAVAELAGLRDLPSLSAVFDLTRQGASVHVVGEVSAKVGQTCVVSLEPIENIVRESIDLKFAPAHAAAAAAGKGERKRVSVDDEQPESLVDGRLDLGTLATEFLILGIDPYPRKAGTQFAAPKGEDRGERPFAALEALKKRLDDA